MEALFSPLTSRIFGGLSLALLIAVGVLALSVGHLKNQRDAARNGLVAQVNGYREAYGRTFREHWQLAQVENQRREALTREANNETIPRRQAALAAADTYRATHACVVRGASQANPGAAGQANRPGSAAAAGSADPSPALAGLVAVTRTSFDNCTLNSADLGVAYDWARKYEALRAQGLAEHPGDTLPH